MHRPLSGGGQAHYRSRLPVTARWCDCKLSGLNHMTNVVTIGTSGRDCGEPTLVAIDR